MASEYLKWKARDIQPDKPWEMTPGEARRNWWYYHKWHVLIGIVLLAIACDLTISALGIGKTAPDCQIAYIGSSPLPEDTLSALEAALSPVCGDLNGDGKAQVTIVQYISSKETPEESAATEIRLLGDLEDCESSLFLLEDPERFQRTYHVLCHLDGSLPEDTDNAAELCCLKWESCPSLTALELGAYQESIWGQSLSGSSEALLSPLYLARRGYWTTKTAPNPEGCAAFWRVLTEGAIS